jgi:hypothetical protein
VLGSHGVSLDTKKLCWVEVTPDTPGTPTTDPVPPVKILISLLGVSGSLIIIDIRVRCCRRERDDRWAAMDSRRASLSDSLARADAALATFSIDEIPLFSRTVLTSSPVLLALHLESGDAVPLPHVAVGTCAGNSPPSTTLVRRTGAAANAAAANAAAQSGGDGPDLPEPLQLLLRTHKRAAYNLFLRWEQSGQRAVPLDAFADGVRQITGTPLSDEDMLAVLQCVEPMCGDAVAILVDHSWRSRPVDCHRLWRRLQSSAARLASRYIKQAVAHKGSPESDSAAAPGFFSHEQQQLLQHAPACTPRSAAVAGE